MIVISLSIISRYLCCDSRHETINFGENRRYSTVYFVNLPFSSLFLERKKTDHGDSIFWCRL